MNDWIPKQQDWITAGYTDFRKRRKKAHSKELFVKHVKKAYADRGVDLDMCSSAPAMFMELFWQCEVLKDWCFELTRLLAIRDGEGIRNRRKHVEMVKELQHLAERASDIFIGEKHAN